MPYLDLKLKYAALLVSMILTLLGIIRVSEPNAFSVSFENQNMQFQERYRVEAALRPNDIAQIGGVVDIYSRFNTSGCLRWHAENGPSSVAVTSEVYVNNRWEPRDPHTLCINKIYYRASITNISSQPQFIIMQNVRMENHVRQAGYIHGTLENLEKMDNYPTPQEITSQGIKLLIIGLGFGVVFIVMHMKNLYKK